jgi:DNA polymerase III subunit gamma/tau
MLLVLYRKYRPQTFGEIIGQEHVVKTLTNAISGGLISHAYLFAGPRGSGKTTMARLLAKALNCQNRKEGESEPCNKCSSCLEINQGNAMDLIEIDAASNRGIDEIKELKEGVKFVPTKSKYKVFILDESHQLTKEASNALLKTLEEPPSHAIFVLATTEIHKRIGDDRRERKSKD